MKPAAERRDGCGGLVLARGGSRPRFRWHVLVDDGCPRTVGWCCDVSRLGGGSGYGSPVIGTRLLLRAFMGVQWLAAGCDCSGGGRTDHGWLSMAGYASLGGVPFELSEPG
ncbi:transducin family protein / WD-40 repeat family protein [Striga asiatica]|uniref:Transducin family protein / WD-40 repeat family protein n=1 Tax=Striga asiatica TaxID=4170 RepID=A0A5A7QPD1_STRAF|nr:transducin family protein / WD-40 repeat family protein [Striga asiatica]